MFPFNTHGSIEYQVAGDKEALAARISEQITQQMDAYSPKITYQRGDQQQIIFKVPYFLSRQGASTPYWLMNSGTITVEVKDEDCIVVNYAASYSTTVLASAAVILFVFIAHFINPAEPWMLVMFIGLLSIMLGFILIGMTYFKHYLTRIVKDAAKYNL